MAGQKLRFEIFKRDGFTCQYCGRKPPEVALNVDHILARANGGRDDHENLLTSCWDCNSGKSDNPIDECQIPSVESVARRRERIAQLEDFNAARLAEEKAIVKAEKDLSEAWAKRAGNHQGKTWSIPERLPDAATRFMKMIGVGKVYEAMDVAFSKFPDQSTDPVYYNARLK